MASADWLGLTGLIPAGSGAGPAGQAFCEGRVNDVCPDRVSMNTTHTLWNSQLVSLGANSQDLVAGQQPMLDAYFVVRPGNKFHAIDSQSNA